MSHRSSKGQNLTLVIFAGLVVLCSIFFVLGMVVGRTQAALPAGVESADVVESSADPEPILDDEFTFYESVADSDPPGLESLPVSPVGAPSPAPTQPDVDAGNEPAVGSDVGGDLQGPDSAPAGTVFLQVTALNNADQADRLVASLREDGYPAFMVRPSDTVPLHRVRVGPFSSAEEAASVRLALEELGFEPIVR